MSALTIRPAFPDDADDLERLAALDSRSVPPGALLIAELDGVLAAALAIGTGEVIADPFSPTAAYVDMLDARARQLRAAGQGEGQRAQNVLGAAMRRWVGARSSWVRGGPPAPGRRG